MARITGEEDGEGKCGAERAARCILILSARNLARQEDEGGGCFVQVCNDVGSIYRPRDLDIQTVLDGERSSSV